MKNTNVKTLKVLLSHDALMHLNNEQKRLSYYFGGSALTTTTAKVISQAKPRHLKQVLTNLYGRGAFVSLVGDQLIVIVAGA